MHRTRAHPQPAQRYRVSEPSWRPAASAAERDHWPAILVAEAEPLLANTLAELLEALHLRLVQARSGAALEASLHADRPLGVLIHLPRAAAQAGHDLSDALDRLARTAPSIPVMAITDPPADAVRAAGDLGAHPLVNLVWLPRPPALRMVIEFLFMAERHHGRGGLIPV